MQSPTSHKEIYCKINQYKITASLATGWFEITRYEDKKSITIANIVEMTWLSRYPWPTLITYDQGSKFIGHKFLNVIKNDYGIKCKPITVRNPQVNAIVERVHQVRRNMIQTFELEIITWMKMIHAGVEYYLQQLSLFVPHIILHYKHLQDN
jgi:transposase InsO family protein